MKVYALRNKDGVYLKAMHVYTTHLEEARLLQEWEVDMWLEKHPDYEKIPYTISQCGDVESDIPMLATMGALNFVVYSNGSYLFHKFTDIVKNEDGSITVKLVPSIESGEAEKAASELYEIAQNVGLINEYSECLELIYRQRDLTDIRHRFPELLAELGGY